MEIIKKWHVHVWGNRISIVELDQIIVVGRIMKLTLVGCDESVACC